MAYVSTEELKRMSRMLMDHAEMIASNYCFNNKHDEPEDVEEVTGKLLKFLGQKIIEVEIEKKGKMDCQDAVRYLQATGMSDKQILTIWEAFSTKDNSIVEIEKMGKMDCQDAVRYLQATGISDEQILNIWEAFSTKDNSI